MQAYSSPRVGTVYPPLWKADPPYMWIFHPSNPHVVGKNLSIAGPTEFQLMLFKSQLYILSGRNLQLIINVNFYTANIPVTLKCNSINMIQNIFWLSMIPYPDLTTLYFQSIVHTNKSSIFGLMKLPVHQFHLYPNPTILTTNNNVFLRHFSPQQSKRVPILTG